MQNAGRGIWRKFSGLSRKKAGWVVTLSCMLTSLPVLDFENVKNLIFVALCVRMNHHKVSIQ
jgi:hypothetical protein